MKNNEQIGKTTSRRIIREFPNLNKMRFWSAQDHMEVAEKHALVGREKRRSVTGISHEEYRAYEEEADLHVVIAAVKLNYQLLGVYNQLLNNRFPGFLPHVVIDIQKNIDYCMSLIDNAYQRHTRRSKSTGRFFANKKHFQNLTEGNV
jgi:hypothetical protein